MTIPLDKYLPTPNDSWTWHLAQPCHVIPIVALAETQYGEEVDQIFTIDPIRMARHVHAAITNQTYDKSLEQIIVAENDQGHVIAWAWLGRGFFTPYGIEECAEAKFLHIDQNLARKSKVRIAAQCLTQWEIFAKIWGISVIVSSTIRSDQAGFMRLHERFGYTIRGSVAWKRVTPKEL